MEEKPFTVAIKHTLEKTFFTVATFEDLRVVFFRQSKKTFSILDLYKSSLDFQRR